MKIFNPFTDQYCKICQDSHPVDGRHWWDNVSAFFLGYRKCMFCRKYCNRASFPENKVDYRWWSCHDCGVTYFYHDKTKELKTYRFVREMKGKEFMLYLDDYGTRLFAETPYNTWSSAPHQILQLDYKLHDVTPDNAYNKIKTLLTFS